MTLVSELPEINYIKGDATDPILKLGVDNYILHCCNDIGAWGAGFVLSLSKRFGNEARDIYKNSLKDFKSLSTDPLGTITLVETKRKDKQKLFIVNMVAQRGIASKSLTVPPIRYEHLVQCLENASRIIQAGSRIHFPLIGAGLAGGDWNVIQWLIRGILFNFECFAYIFPKDVQFFHFLEKK